MPSSAPGNVLTVTAAPRAAPAARAVAAWRVGQVLEALVARVEGPARAWLRIGPAEVPVRTHAPLTPGARLTLRVASTRPAVTLMPVRAPAPGAGRAPETVTVPSAWRVVLPRQRPLAEALGRMLAAGLPAGREAGPAPRSPTTEPLAALAARLPVPATLARPEGLAAAIAASGLFLEARLARGEAPPPGDLKLALARAAAALRAAAGGEPPAAPKRVSAPREAPEPGPARAPAGREPSSPPPAPRSTPAERPEPGVPRTSTLLAGGAPAHDASDAAEAALARVTARQLESLPRGGEETPRWSLELPVRLADGRLAGLHLRIGDERGRNARDDEGRRWQVRLALELPDGGAVHAAVALAGRRVGVRFVSPDARLAQALSAGLPRLAEALQRRGLEPGVLDSRAGRPPGAEDPVRLRPPGLLDTEA